MRKALLITIVFLLLTLSITQSAIAQRQNIITNQTTEPLYVVYSTKFGAHDAIPAGYWTAGWKEIQAGQQEAFWAYDPHKIYFQIWKGSQRVKPLSSTQTLAFWINRNADFNVVTQQEINASITRGQLVYSSHDTSALTHSDGFMRYNNGSRIAVTNAWVDVPAGIDPDADGDEMSDRAPVHIPDDSLREELEVSLRKDPDSPITAADMLTLTELDLSYPGLQDLTGLEFAKNLTFLRLSTSKLSTLTPLAGLRNLTKLDLDIYELSDLTPLAGLTNLTELSIAGYELSDLMPLAGLTNLTKLEIHVLGGELSDLTPLAGLRNLTELNVSDSRKLSDVSPLAGLRNLTKLGIRSSAISDVTPLAGLTNLTVLYLDNNAISDVSPLAGLTNLTQLDLRRNEISDVSPLAGLTNLNTLSLQTNWISDFSPIAGLIPNLDFYSNSDQTVVVSPNTPVNIPDPTLRAAIEKALGKTSGATIAGADMLTLQTFMYSGAFRTKIRDLTGIEFATNLTELWLQHNEISDLSPLAHLKNLETLVLPFNLISDVSPLANLENLTKLVITDNQISDFSPVARLVPGYVASYQITRKFGACGTVISEDSLDPLKGVSVTPLIEKETIAPQDGISHSVVKFATSSEGGRNRAWTTYDTVATDAQEKFSLILTIEFLDGWTFRDERNLVEKAVKDWTSESNIVPLFVSNGKSDIRVKFDDIKTGEWHVKTENVGAPLGDRNTHWNSNEYTMYLATDFSYATALHEFGHALGLVHEHLNPKFLEYFKWREDTKLPEFGTTQFYKKIGDSTGLSSNTDIYHNLFAIREVDEERSSFDMASVMTYYISKEFLEVLPNTPLGIEAAFENNRGIPDNAELSEGDREFIVQCYGPALNRAEISGEVHIDGKDDETLDPTKVRFNLKDGFYIAHETINETETISEYTVTHHWKFHGKQVAVFKWGGECRVQVYVSTRKIGYGEVEAAVTALLYEGITDRTDDLEDMSCWDVTLPLDGNDRVIRLELLNDDGAMKLDSRTVECRDIVLDYSESRFSPDFGGDGDEATVTVTLRAKSVDPSEYVPAAPSIPVGGITSFSETTRRDLFSDVNGDGHVDTADLLLVSNYIGQTGSVDPRVDVNGDGSVTIADLVLVAQYLGQSTHWSAPGAVVVPAGLKYSTVAGWIDQARVENDGSLVFQQGLAKLEYLLTLIIPEKTALLPNYPNPFNPETWIPYHLAAPAEVTLTIYAIDGRVVRHLDLGHQAAGYYQGKSRAAYWDGRNNVGERVASGIYFYTLTAGDFAATKKMLIRK